MKQTPEKMYGTFSSFGTIGDTNRIVDVYVRDLKGNSHRLSLLNPFVISPVEWWLLRGSAVEVEFIYIHGTPTVTKLVFGRNEFIPEKSFEFDLEL